MRNLLLAVALALGGSQAVGQTNTGVIEGLYASDLAYLQRLYEQFNTGDADESTLTTGAAATLGSNSLRRMTTLGEA